MNTLIQFPKQVLLGLLVLLLTAAFAHSQVFTVNAVGYVNTQINPGYNLITNPFADPIQLDNPDYLRFSEDYPEGLTIYKYNSATGAYDRVVYDSEEGTFDQSLTLASGEGFIVLNPLSTPFTITFVGSINQGIISYSFSKGTHLVGSKIPMAGKISQVIKIPPIPGAQVFIHNGSSYQGFLYDDLENGWIPYEPSVKVGEAFWLRLPEAASWSHEFQINQ